MNFKELSSETDVREALIEWMNTNGYSQADVARKLDKSNTVVSLFLKGKYTGNNRELVLDILEMMHREVSRKQENVDIPIVLTENVRDIMAVCSLLHQIRKIGVISASSGYGKTTGITTYIKKHNQSVLVTAIHGMTEKDLLAEILETVNSKIKNPYRYNKYKLVKFIIKELQGKDLLIIIDEAQHLQLGHFEKVRQIHDATNAPILFAGTNTVVDQMTGTRNFDFDQIYSRVPMKKSLDGRISRDDVKLILNAVGVTDNGIVRYLEKKVNEQGHFRKLQSILSLSLRFSKKDRIALNMEHLLAAEQLLLGKRYSELANKNND